MHLTGVKTEFNSSLNETEQINSFVVWGTCTFFINPKKSPAKIFWHKKVYQNVSKTKKSQIANFKPKNGFRTSPLQIHLIPPPPPTEAPDQRIIKESLNDAGNPPTQFKLVLGVYRCYLSGSFWTCQGCLQRKYLSLKDGIVQLHPAHTNV